MISVVIPIPIDTVETDSWWISLLLTILSTIVAYAGAIFGVGGCCVLYEKYKKRKFDKQVEYWRKLREKIKS